MRYRNLGSSDVKVSEISFGCWTMGGLNWSNGASNGWASVDEDEIARAIKLGVDAGVNHFDNADVYGNGRSERMLARVLQKLGLRSTDFVIATKVGHFPGTAAHAYEPAHIRHQCEQSLINLKRDHIDLYYFHHGDFGPGDRYLPGAVETMEQLVKEGKVRLKGQSAYSENDFERIVPALKPQVLQSWAHALDDHFVRPGSRIVKLMEEYGMTFVAFSPLAQALLLGKYKLGEIPHFEPGDIRSESGRFKPESLAEVLPKVDKLKARFGSETEKLASVALNYVLAQPRVACVIPGFRNERQAQCNVAAAGNDLGEEEIAFIRAALA